MTRYILATCLLLAAAAPACANDGGISFGGAPRLLSGHPTVSMETEMVNMTVGAKVVTVDCTFLFRNHGPACTVRMGFPDEGRGTKDPDEEHADDYEKRPAVTLFHSFRSWVDGKELQTKLVRSDKPGLFWHSKTVSFSENGAHVVHDVYTVDVGAGIVGDTGGKAIFGDETYYTLHTGSSWHGPIRKTVVNVRFDRPGVKTPLKVQRIAEKQTIRTGPSAIRYSGPCAPFVDGAGLRFIRTNWRPTEKDDIYLVFSQKSSN